MGRAMTRALLVWWGVGDAVAEGLVVEKAATTVGVVDVAVVAEGVAEE